MPAWRLLSRLCCLCGVLCAAQWLAAAPPSGGSVKLPAADLPERPAAADADRAAVKVVHESDDGRRIRISVSAAEGIVFWSDVWTAVLQAARLDDTALPKIAPNSKLDLNQRGIRYLLIAANLTMPGVHFQRTTRGEQRLLVDIDRDQVEKHWRFAKSRLRNRVTGQADGADDRYGLQVDEQWNRSTPDRLRVVYVHGLNSDPESGRQLIEQLRDDKVPSATFTYPNDQPVQLSAQRLATELRQQQREHPGLRVALVTHSMGGLVARAVIEQPKWDCASIERLIMIAPPNGGSRMAHFAVGLDLWEHFVQVSGVKFKLRFYRGFDDGLGEAVTDLKPGSGFLKRLNQASRNQRVAYTILLGDRAPLSAAQLKQIRAAVQLAAERNRAVRLFHMRLDEILSDLEELVSGAGDGAVSLKRGRLSGVDDVHVLSFDHDIVWQLDTPVGQRVLELVMDRLTEKAASGIRSED